MPERLPSIDSGAGMHNDALRTADFEVDGAVAAMSPCLPSGDRAPAVRTEALSRRRSKWLWSYDQIDGMALLQTNGAEEADPKRPLNYKELLPLEAQPPSAYLAERAASLVPLAAAVVRDRSRTDPPSELGPLCSVGEYHGLIRAPLALPETCRRGLEDDVFAWQRVAGLNPLVIRSVRKLPANVALNDEVLPGAWRMGLELATELADGNIFITDYTVVDGIGPSRDDAGVRHVWPLVGVFHVDRKASPNAKLMPLAIQLGTKGAPDHLFTPNDGPRWTIAKTALQCADITLHGLDPHLARLHLAMEGVVVACHRTLSHRHPLMVLLRPHFRIGVFRNLEMRTQFMRSDGPLERLMAGAVRNGMTLLHRNGAGQAKRVYGATGTVNAPAQTIGLAKLNLLADLAGRGADRIPSYPYAEDAVSVWGALRTFCREYVALYYCHDDAVAQDEELQALVRELASPTGGRLHGVRPVHSRNALVDLITHVIFSCGPQHSALNLAQYAYAASAANMPMALYRSLPDDLKDLTDDQARAFRLEMLPPIEKAEAQLRWMVERTSYQFDQFGHYQPEDFTDPSVQAALQRFRDRLAAIDQIVDARNTARLEPYPFLQPKNILNSASI